MKKFTRPHHLGKGKLKVGEIQVVAIYQSMLTCLLTKQRDEVLDQCLNLETRYNRQSECIAANSVPLVRS
jgi:hypothetical protein